MFPLIAAVELLAKDFVLAAERPCEFLSKHEETFTLLLSFAMTYSLCKNKFSLLLFRFILLLNFNFCLESTVILSPFSPPSVLAHIRWLMTVRIYMSEGLQRIQKHIVSGCCIKVKQICFQIA